MQYESCLPDELGFNGMSDVYYGSRRVDAEYHALHAGDVTIAGTEIGRQRDDSRHLFFLIIKRCC